MAETAPTREIDCPRCHEQCGWCSDYRHMHGKLRLPGSRKYCTIESMHPDDVCPMCGGSKRVNSTTIYSKIAVGSLDDGVPNRFDHSRRGFQP